MSLAEQIIDTVLKCHTCIRGGQSDRRTAFEAFYSEISELFRNNRDRFDECSYSLLKPDDYSGIPETTVIRLECAGIFHKNGLDAYLFRIRYYLNLATDQDDILLERKISSAFALKGNVALESFDARSPYEKLLLNSISQKEVCCEALMAEINHFVANKWKLSFEDLIPFVQVARLLGKEVPQGAEMLFLVLTEIPAMLSDGLCLWISNTPDYKKKLSQLASACREMGMIEEWRTFRSLIEKLDADSERIPIG